MDSLENGIKLRRDKVHNIKRDKDEKVHSCRVTTSTYGEHSSSAAAVLIQNLASNSNSRNWIATICIYR